MKTLAAGKRPVHRVDPQPGDLAAAIGNAGVDVISTPAIIAYLGTAGYLLIQSNYEPGEASVGTRVNVEHVAAALLGSEPVCRVIDL